MALKLITPPVNEPVSIEEARAQCRYDDSSNDVILTMLVQAAREQAEHRTGRVLITQTWELALDAFPDGEIELQKLPAASISSVKYLDEAAVEQTIAAINYGMDNYGLQHWLFPAAGYEWPTALSTANAVKVRYIAGYGDTGASVPAGLKRWMLGAIAYLDANRGEELPRDFQGGDLDPYRVYP